MRQQLTPAQNELLRMMSFVKSPQSLNELKKVIADYFAKKLQQSVDDMWATGELSEQKVENFRRLHQRTPYKQ